MARFDPEHAVLGILTADLADNPEDTVFSYINPTGLKILGDKIIHRKVIDLLRELLNSDEEARKAFAELIQKGSLVTEGALNGRTIQYHSIVKLQEKHLQVSVADTTESRRAREGFEYTVKALAKASEGNDEDTGKHVVRINEYSAELARILGQEQDFIDRIRLLAQLHDVGKIHISPSILKKSGSLTQTEFKEMKDHTIYGAEIIGTHPNLAMGREIALWHHEKWDGTGYPQGIFGSQIPLSARIVSIVDVFDALVSSRSYKEPFPYDQALDILSHGDDRLSPEKHFDPDVHHSFIENYHRFTGIHSRMTD